MASEPSADKQRSSPSLNETGESLFEQAKKRLAAVDAKSDGKADGDEELRQEALRFIQKECLSLPDAEFMKLLSKIEAALKRKDAEIGTIQNESQNALKEISNELSLLPLSNFDPRVKNPEEVAEYLRTATFTIDGRNAFMDLLDANSECAVGLVRNWNESHPVRKALASKGFEAASTVSALDRKQTDLASFLNNGDTKNVDAIGLVEWRKSARQEFSALTKDGFPDVSKPETAKKLADIRIKGWSDVFWMLFNGMKDSPTLGLAFVAAWEIIPNAARDALLKHPDEGVRNSVSTLDAIRQKIALSFWYDANYLPNDFKKSLVEQSFRFETRNDRAKETASWNAENRKFLTEKWNALVRAKIAGDASAVEKTWQEVENFFQGNFRRQHDDANAYFYGLVDHQQPDAYKEFLAIAWTRQLFMGVRNAHSPKGTPSSDATAAAKPAHSEINQFDEAFRSAVDGSWTSVLSRDGDGTLTSKNQQNFILETRREKHSQAILDPVGLANYLSLAYVRGGEKEFRNVLRADFWSDYDALVLKFADASGLIGKGENARSKYWKEVVETLTKTDPGALDALHGFVGKEAETILANGTALRNDDLESVRKMMKIRHSPEKIENVLKSMKDKPMKEQFDILLSACPEMTHGEVQEIFLEISRKTKNAADAGKKEAERIIPGDEIMEYVPGFVHLKIALAESRPGETPQEAGARYSMLRRLQEGNRLKANAFFESFWDNAEYFVNVLKAEAEKSPVARAACENFAAWLENKTIARKGVKASVAAQSVANEGARLSATEGADAKAAGKRGEFHKAAETGEKLWEKMARVIERADSLEAEGKKAEAAELRRQAFGRPDWSLSSDLPDLASMKDSIERIEKEGKYWLAEAEKRRMEIGMADGGKKDADRISTHSWDSPERVASLIATELPVWRAVRVPVGNESTNVTVEKTADVSTPYVVKVDGKNAFVCSDKNLAANLQMADLLSRNGLAFLAPVSTELLKLSSVAKGDFATANDGDFWDREKRELLSAAAKALGVTDFPHASTDLSEMSRRFQSVSTQENTSVREIWIRNGVLDVSGNVRNREEFFASVRR